jgi:hypothetical protein
MKTKSPIYHGYRFPPEVISHAMWLYHRFCLSFREVEELLAERGITVTYETIRQWCRRRGSNSYGRFHPWDFKFSDAGGTMCAYWYQSSQFQPFGGYCQLNGVLAD